MQTFVLRTALPIAVSCVVLLTGMSTAHEARAADPSPPGATPAADDAQRFYQEGNAAFKREAWADAEAAYLKAWALSRSFDVAANLGETELELGKHLEAAQFLSFGLRNAPPSAKQEQRERARQSLDKAKKKIATIHLTLNLPGANLSIDGAAIDAAFAGPELFVAPGQRVIEASAEGHRAARRTVDAKEGDAISVTLTLLPEERPVQRSIVPPLIAFGAGGAGLVLGVVAGAVAAAGNDRLSQTCDPSGLCPDSARGDFDTTVAMSHASTAGFVIAGVGAAVGVTLLLLPAKSPGAPRAAVHVGPAFVGVKGVF